MISGQSSSKSSIKVVAEDGWIITPFYEPRSRANADADDADDDDYNDGGDAEEAEGADADADADENEAVGLDGSGSGTDVGSVDSQMKETSHLAEAADADGQTCAPSVNPHN